MGVESVNDIEGRVGHDFDLAFTCRHECMLLGTFGCRHAPGEGCRICLNGLRVRVESCVCGCAGCGGGEVESIHAIGVGGRRGGEFNGDGD